MNLNEVYLSFRRFADASLLLSHERFVAICLFYNISMSLAVEVKAKVCQGSAGTCSFHQFCAILLACAASPKVWLAV